MYYTMYLQYQMKLHMIDVIKNYFRKATFVESDNCIVKESSKDLKIGGVSRICRN